MTHLEGAIVPVITPFTKAGRIDGDAMARHIGFLIAHGVQGIACLGTVGEFGVMTLREREHVIQIACAAAGGRISVLAGVGDTCEKNTICLAKRARACGANAILLLPPYFSVYAPDMVKRYMLDVAAKAALPIVLYNFPALSGFDMTADWVGALAADCDAIVGIKETVADIGHIRRMLAVKRLRSDFRVFAAYEDQFLDALRMGADGFINATANFAPEYTAGLFASYCAGADAAALSNRQRKLNQAMAVYACSKPLLLAVKQAVYERLDMSDQGERLPGRSLDASECEKVRCVLASLAL